ncbi:uncharacterized protein N7503_011450 [Penicillium pulvis]|uniref:uncharacterized protein n=1 Tax=Penicillium pulvis TaxID=1562058 RepID=UPI002549B776|nr:uncharacterized protein N7503_011450 [Penicillium pulvis]KAJ5786238.1 hypothetical protein N7503_011450 [Penicillium pulvis]
MIEAKTRHADWSEVDVDTFVRLCEFAYFRNYTPPPSGLFNDRSHVKGYSKAAKKRAMRKKARSKWSWNGIVPPPTDPEPAPDAEPEPEPVPEPMSEPVSEPELPPPDKTIYDDSEITYKERSIWTGQLRDAFASSLAIPASRIPDLSHTFIPPVNSGSWDDFTPVFLDQARLYVLADKYCIDSLCQLVLSKLHQTLSNFKLYDNGVDGIIEFVRFVYLNTPPNYGDRVDALRNLATRYVVSILGQIGENEEFQKLLEDGGPFVSDFWHIIWSVKGEAHV